MTKSEDGQGTREKAHGCHGKKFDFYPGVLGQSLKGFRQDHGYSQSTRQVNPETRRCWPSNGKEWREHDRCRGARGR